MEDASENKIENCHRDDTPKAQMIESAAMQLLRWAHDRNLLVHGAYFPVESYEHPTLEQATSEGIAILRQKQIRSIGINPAASQIVVYLNRAAPGARQQVTLLPSTCNGFAIKYRQGLPDNVSPAAIAEAASPCAVHTSTNGVLHYTCGSSISLGNARAAGTLGCLVKNAAGDIFGLSNNHVAGGCNYAPAGLPILAPGVIDVSPYMPRPFSIGALQRQLHMSMGDPSQVNTADNQDAAIFSIYDPSAVSSMQQSFYDTPAVAMDLTPGMRVKKVGRTSGFTEGIVQSEQIGPLMVTYSAAEYGFSGAVYFDRMHIVTGIDDRFSDSGDSGSLVVHQADDGHDYAVGIVVAGGADNQAPGGKMSLIMPIRPILDLFGVQLVSGHNI